jgi:hypothetical protein
MNVENKARFLAKLVRSLLHDERFETIADLTDALKFRCARLHIPCSNDDITAAYRLIGSNRALVESPRTTVSRGTPRAHDRERHISREEAARILEQLGVSV